MTYQFVQFVEMQRPMNANFLTPDIPVVIDKYFINEQEIRPQVSSFSIIEKYIDHTNETMNDLAKLMGKESRTDNCGYIGMWNDDICLEEGVQIYYYIDFPTKNIFKFIITEIPSTLELTNQNNECYIMNIDGKMTIANPEAGDLITTSKDEALDWIEKYRQQLTNQPTVVLPKS